MQKQIMLSIVLMLPLTQVMGQHLAGGYTVTMQLGQLKGHPKKIYFWYDAFSKGRKVTHEDSATVKNNTVQFMGLINEPHEAFLSIKPRLTKTRVNDGDRLSFYLTAASIKIYLLDSLNTYTQNGGQFIKDYKDFKKIKGFYDHKIIALAVKAQQLKDKDSVGYLRLMKEFNETVDLYANKVCKNWAVQHRSSPVSLLPLRWYAGSVIVDPNGVDSVYSCLNTAIKTMPTAIDLKRQIDNVMRAAIGNKAPLFIMPDTSGKPIALTSYLGKYVLLDFWASWCAPCRRENRNVLANFNTYHHSNFQVISVSLDSKNGEKAWLNAIRADGLGQWPNLSDLKGFNNIAAISYGVQAVPQNFLIDPSGKIVAKNLFGAELSKKLREVMPL